MKKVIKWVTIPCLFLVLSGALYIGYVDIKATQKEKDQTDELLTGMIVMSDKEYEEYLKETPSDIKGLTRYEKQEMGLDPAPGSDSDQDGLTDKEEIEVYHSDPLAASTAGDLYFDSYKVENGMDLHTFYDYNTPVVFMYNECPEVLLKATVPSDFNTVVKNKTGEWALNNYETLAVYYIYNYTGELRIDLTNVLKEKGLTTKNIKIYVAEETKTKKTKFTSENNIICLKKDFECCYEYTIYVVEK